MVTVRALAPDERAACEVILRALPDWFGIEESIVDYVAEIEVLDTYGAFDGERLAGFLTVRPHFAESAEVLVMGVRPELHRRGIGSALLAHAEAALRASGARWLQVKTLGPSHADEFYARTRAFYAAHGFDPLEENASRWPGNPCLTMVKKL